MHGEGVHIGQSVSVLFCSLGRSCLYAMWNAGIGTSEIKMGGLSFVRRGFRPRRDVEDICLPVHALSATTAHEGTAGNQHEPLWDSN